MKRLQRALVVVGLAVVVCAPFALLFPPETPFQAVIDGALPGAYSYHPDFAKIDWSQVEWFKSGEPWQPKFDQSLTANGLGHKAVVRFRTPGLTGIEGSCS